MTINFEYYKVFYYVSRYGSLTAAAKELCISQPAVSQAVRRLGEGGGYAASCFPHLQGRLLLTPGGRNFCTGCVKSGVESLLEGQRDVEPECWAWTWAKCRASGPAI